MARLVPVLATLPLVAWVGPARAESQAPEPPAWEYDAENAQEILETCAGCHGRTGKGGKGGTYPRLAGLDEGYMVRQMQAFKDRERINHAMLPYATERELSENDTRDISRLYSRIELPTTMPKMPAGSSSLELMRAAVRVFNVPPVDGDVERGGQVYVDECGDCHGDDGWGDGDVPQLAGQYTEYLRGQIDAFRSGERKNDDMEGVFDDLGDDELDDLFAWLASRDDS